MRQIDRLFLLLGLFLLAIVSGCRRIPMYEREAGIYLRLSVDLSLDPAMEARLDVDISPDLSEKVVGKIPEMVRACFYDAVSHELVKEDFLPIEGGFVDVPAGVYDVVVYTLGTEVTQVSGTESRALGYAFTSSTGVRVKLMGAQAKGDEKEGEEAAVIDEQSVIMEPDHMFVGKIAGATVPVHPADEEIIVLSSEMSRISESWTLEILNIIGAEHIQNAEVYVTGQAAGRYLWDRRPVGHPSAIEFASEIDIQKGHLFSVFNTFGKYQQSECDVLVNVLVTTKSGFRCRYVFDVTEQWLNPDNTAHSIVIDEAVEVPGADNQGDGVDPTVTDWGDEEYTIIIEC